MSLHRLFKSLSTPTMRKKDMPVFFRVPYLESGYRKIHQPWKYYMLSVFQMNTECLNVWSHVAGTMLMLSRIVQLSHQFDLTDRHKWPLLTGLLTFTFMFGVSSVAHMFSHRSERTNCILFMFDFSAIGLYCYGTVVSHYYYSLDEHFHNTWLQTSAVPIGTIFAILVCICGCSSKVMFRDINSKSRTWLVVMSVGSSYIWSNIPIVHRLFTQNFTDGLYFHAEQIICMSLVAFFFSSRIPERLCPGSFDFIGNSHQIFHVIMVICTQKHIDGVQWDIQNMSDSFTKNTNIIPTLYNTFGNVAFILLVDSTVIFMFYLFFQKMR